MSVFKTRFRNAWGLSWIRLKTVLNLSWIYLWEKLQQFHFEADLQGKPYGRSASLPTETISNEHWHGKKRSMVCPRYPNKKAALCLIIILTIFSHILTIVDKKKKLKKIKCQPKGRTANWKPALEIPQNKNQPPLKLLERLTETFVFEWRILQGESFTCNF